MGLASVAGCSGGSETPDGGGADGSGTGEPTDTPGGTEEPSSVSVRMFRYDPARTGSPPGAAGPTGSVTERWAFETDGGIGSSPAVVEGTVYVGSADQHLYALTE